MERAAGNGDRQLVETAITFFRPGRLACLPPKDRVKPIACPSRHCTGSQATAQAVERPVDLTAYPVTLGVGANADFDRFVGGG